MNIFRRIFAPIALRFQDTDALLDALDVLGRARDAKNLRPDLRTTANQGEIMIARELVRRNVCFW